jgi:hypothetical protein
MEKSQIILQCQNCHALFRVSTARWNKLLERWGTATNIIDNYICKGCELPYPTVKKVNYMFQEHSSPEEDIALRQTIDGKHFNVTAVKNFFKKMAIWKRLYSKHTKPVRVVSQEDLQKFEAMHNKEVEEKEE